MKNKHSINVKNFSLEDRVALVKKYEAQGYELVSIWDHGSHLFYTFREVENVPSLE